MTALVSIIVPVYNTESFLKQCIESILCQSYSNIELLLIDDGSKDMSGMICLHYVHKDKRVKYIYQDNKGVSSARNKGIELAKGEYIVFVDSDDFIKNGLIERLMADINIEFAMCGYELYDDTMRFVIRKYISSSYDGDICNFLNNIDVYLQPPFLLSPCFKLFCKDIIKRFELKFPVDLAYGEDAMFVFEYLIHCNNVNVSEYVGYTYRKHSTTTLSSKFIRNKIDINNMINFKIEELLKKNKILSKEKILSDRLLENFVSYTKEIVRSDLNLYDKYELFYEKFSIYNANFSVPKRLAQRIVICAGKYRVCFPLIYLFRIY